MPEPWVAAWRSSTPRLRARAGGQPRGASRLERRERAERLELNLRGPAPGAPRRARAARPRGDAYDEIALITDSPLGSVKGRLHRARNELIGSSRNNAYDWELPQ